MVAKHRYRNDDGDMEDVPTVLRWGWTLKEASEEGEAPMVTVLVDDPTMSLNFVGHRRWIVHEDESEADDDVIFSGFVQKQTIAHKGGDITNPLGRVWSLELIDMNTLWTNRILVGSDTKRPAESDVERMGWLVDTEEMGYFSDETLLSSLDPVDMDKEDVRGQYTSQVADSCAQQSGKNWWIGARSDGIFVWYGKDTYDGYDSPLSLSNDPAELDMEAVDAGTATTYPLGKDTELGRDPQRIYSGAYVEYQKGAVYRKDTDTEEMFILSGRDIASPAPELKTKTKANARALRILAASDSQELVITTTATLPARKVSQMRTGMRIPITMTHGTDGFPDTKLCRILNAAASPISNGSWYTVAIEAIPVGDPPEPLSCSTALAGIEHDVVDGAQIPYMSFVVGDPSDTITPSFAGRLIAFMFAMNPDTPSSTGMTVPSGYSSFVSENAMGRSTYTISTKAGSSGISSTASTTYSPGFMDGGCWQAHQLALRTSASSPVQDKYRSGSYQATFDSTPTPGNIMLMFAIQTDCVLSGNIPAPTGWSVVWQDYNIDINGLGTACFARCVEPGDGATWDYSPLGGGPFSLAIYLQEWEIT